MNGPRLARDSLGVKDPRSGVARDSGFTLLQEVACACSVAICGSTTCRAGCAPRIDHPISKTTGRRTRSGRMADEADNLVLVYLCRINERLAVADRGHPRLMSSEGRGL